MQFPDRLRRERPSSAIFLLLGLTLALSAVLLYQAIDASRSHRRAAESALRDYAAFAAWELTRRAELAATEAIYFVLTRAALEASGGRERPPPSDSVFPVFEAAALRELERCGCAGAAESFFVTELDRGVVHTTPGASDGLRAWLAAVLPTEAGATPLQPAGPAVLRTEEVVRLRSDGEPMVERRVSLPGPRLLQARVDGRRRAVLFTLANGPAGAPARAFGAVLEPAGLAPMALRRVLRSAPLLPASLTRGADNLETLAVRVEDATGATIFAAGGEAGGSPTVREELPGPLRGLTAHVAVRPEIAGRLVIGGLPRSRLPLLLGVFALTLGLAVVAFVQLRRQQELARLRSDFVSGVSHELRTPLAQIRLFADLLESERLGVEQRRRSVRIIGEEARRLGFLVENVLRFSRAERAGQRISPEPTDVADLVEAVVDSFAPLARASGARVRTRLQRGVVAPMDRDAMRQVLLNLLDNALKYGPPAQDITVGAVLEGTRLRLWVDDEGPGVPPAERERVWEPYRRLERDASGATGGSGIGLSVVRELVALHGGEAGIEDAPGGGARFVVRLPGAAAVDAERREPDERGAAEGEAPPQRRGQGVAADAASRAAER